MIDFHGAALLHDCQNAGDAQQVVGGLRSARPYAGQLAKLTQLGLDGIMQINPATTSQWTEAQR
ncbi:hypothetical protein D3C86_1853380 [compost metagenome]